MQQHPFSTILDSPLLPYNVFNSSPQCSTIYIYIYMSPARLPAHLPACPPTCPPACPPACPHACPPACPALTAHYSLPELAALKARLQSEGFGAVFMTGSGSTIVAVGSDIPPPFCKEAVKTQVCAPSNCT